VCLPLASRLTANGAAQAAQAPSSSLHSNDAPGSDVQSNVALLAVVLPTGPAVNAGAAGAAVSSVHVVAAPCERLPAASTARTATVWLPSAMPAGVNGDVQAIQSPPSS